MALIYLDHLSATPLHPKVKEAMIQHLETVFGNPSSDHQVGQPAADALEKARAQVAALLNAAPQGDRLHLRRHRGQQPRPQGRGHRP